MVKEVTKMVNSPTRKGGIYAVQSPRMLVTGISLHMPTTKCEQYIQGHVGGPNNTDVKRTIDLLYIGRNDNGSGHWVFKLNTKEQVSVNGITVIPMSKDFRQQIDEIGTNDAQPVGIQIPDKNGNLTIHGFLTPESNTDSYASDESYKYPDDKLENDVPLNVENINKGAPDSELQRDHFQGRNDAIKKGAFDGDDNNDEDDYVSIASTNSISIHSTNTTNKSTSSNNKMDIDILSTQDDDAVSTASKASEQTPKELQSTLDSEN